MQRNEANPLVWGKEYYVLQIKGNVLWTIVAALIYPLIPPEVFLDGLIDFHWHSNALRDLQRLINVYPLHLVISS